MHAVKQAVNPFINVVIVGSTRLRCSVVFSRAAGNDLHFYSNGLFLKKVYVQRSWEFLLDQTVWRTYRILVYMTETNHILSSLSGPFSSQASAYQPADLSVHFRASLVSHRCLFLVRLRAQIGPFCLTLRQTNYLLWGSFIHTSFTSHLNLPPLTSPSSPPPSAQLGPWRNACWVTLRGLASLPLPACHPQSAVIWCEIHASAGASQGQGLVIDVSYSSVSCVFSSSFHRGPLFG